VCLEIISLSFLIWFFFLKKIILTVDTSSPELKKPALNTTLVDGIRIINNGQTSIDHKGLDGWSRKVIFSAQLGGNYVCTSNTKRKNYKWRFKG
jgi:hypothetical protein